MQENNNLAPIVLFVYNRLDHTKQTIEALQKNYLASESELFIYSDAAKNPEAKHAVNAVRAYLKSVDGLKKVSIIERDKNWGLASSIIDGVTTVVNEYDKIIVLEDDLVTSPYFLTFMNQSLDIYSDKKKVWHISGWNYDLELHTKEEAFFWRAMNCWGWATWKDRWSYYKKDVDAVLQNFTKQQKRDFTLNNTIPNLWEQVVANKTGQINTWAIFWSASIFEQHGLCLNPVVSYVENTGLDGSGTHGDVVQKCTQNINEGLIKRFPQSIEENKDIVQIIGEYSRSQFLPLHQKIINKIKRILR